MLKRITNFFNELSFSDAERWIHKNPGKVSNIILAPGEAGVLVGGLALILTGNIAGGIFRTWTGVQGLKAAAKGFMEGDTVYDTALSDPRLKMNPAYIPPGTSNWDQWTKDNVRQYSNLAWSGSLGSWMDVGLSGFGLAAFKTLTVKDPDKQIFDVASKLDAIAYKPENTQPISFWSADSLKNNFVTPVTDLLVTVKNDVSDLGGFLSNNTLSLAKDTLTSVPEQSQNLVNYLSGGTITEDIGTWWNSWESLERAKKSDTYQGASTRAEKFLRALPYAANDLAEKATDVFMLPLRGVFKVLEKPSESVAESIRQYGIERGIDGKKAISERLQNYSELPYMAGGLVAFGMSIWMGAPILATVAAGSMFLTGLSYAASNAYQRKSGNVPGMDLDLPVYLHKPDDIDSHLLHGINEDIPQYKELTEAIKVVLASEKDYIQWLQTTAQDKPGALFELNPDGSYKVNQRDYFLDLEKTLKTTPVDFVFEPQADGSYKINEKSFRAWLKDNEGKVDWPKKEDDSYNLDRLGAMGYTQIKDPSMKLSVAQIVGLPDLKDWPENALPAEADAIIKRAEDIKAARERGEEIKGSIPIPGEIRTTIPVPSYAGSNVILLQPHFVSLKRTEQETLQTFWDKDDRSSASCSLNDLALALNDDEFFQHNKASFPKGYETLRRQIHSQRAEWANFEDFAEEARERDKARWGAPDLAAS